MEPNTPQAEASRPAPVMDVRPRPQVPSATEPQVATETPAAQPADKKHSKPSQQPAPKAPKQPSSGIGLAIFATVVIVLGLAALTTYAYIKTK